MGLEIAVEEREADSASDSMQRRLAEVIGYRGKNVRKVVLVRECADRPQLINDPISLGVAYGKSLADRLGYSGVDEVAVSSDGVGYGQIDALKKKWSVGNLTKMLIARAFSGKPSPCKATIIDAVRNGDDLALFLLTPDLAITTVERHGSRMAQAFVAAMFPTACMGSVARAIGPKLDTLTEIKIAFVTLGTRESDARSASVKDVTVKTVGELTQEYSNGHFFDENGERMGGQ